MGVPTPMVAGAVLGGSYLGDKMSPLSDTTNLASGIAGVDLFEHIKAMLATTVPATLIALGGFVALSMTLDVEAGSSAQEVALLQEQLAGWQQPSPLLLLPALVILVMALFKQPGIPTLMASAAVAGLLAMVVQGQPPAEVAGTFLSGFESASGHDSIDALLSRGGMQSMLNTVLLVMAATALGGILERGRFLEVVLGAILQRVRRPRGLITATVGSSIASNVLLSDQYLSIVLPGRLYRESYPQLGLERRMLSRSLEDGGTVTSCLVPWNSGGAYMAATLGVPTLQYLPYCFLNLAMPLVAILFAWVGWYALTAEGRERASE